KTLKPEIRSRVRAMGGNPDSIRFCQYGYHKGTNEYRDFKHAILVGVHQQPISSITSLVYGTSKARMSQLVSRVDIDLMRMSQVMGDIKQAVGRIAIRNMTPEGDVPPGCTVTVIASSHPSCGMCFHEPIKTLGEIFPGANIKAKPGAEAAPKQLRATAL